MRTSFATLLLSAFLGISMLGIFAMNMNHGAHEGCIATAMTNSPCPDGSNQLAFLGFHFDAFRNFSAAVFASSVLSLFLIVFSVVYGFSRSPHGALSLKLVSFAVAQRPLLVKEKIRHWFSLHENSPGALYGRF